MLVKGGKIIAASKRGHLSIARNGGQTHPKRSLLAPSWETWEKIHIDQREFIVNRLTRIYLESRD